MKYIAIVFILIFCLFSTNVNAANGKVITLHFYKGHTGVLVKLDNMTDLGNCGRSDWYMLDNSHPHYKEIYSLLLMAKASDKAIKLHINGCKQGLSNIVHVWLT